MSGVGVEEVRRVAELASLDLTSDEVPKMQRDLSAILNYVALLGELDTENVEPMAQVSDLLAQGSSANGETLRIDQVSPSLDRRDVLSSAPDTDGRFFKVPKVIDR